MRLARVLLEENSKETSFEVSALDATEYRQLQEAFELLGCEIVARNPIRFSLVVNCPQV